MLQLHGICKRIVDCNDALRVRIGQSIGTVEPISESTRAHLTEPCNLIEAFAETLSLDYLWFLRKFFIKVSCSCQITGNTLMRMPT